MEKPNILYILADDLGWADVSMHGSLIRTPSIDQLAASGVELQQHYVCPMCTPTRASLLTGRHPGLFGAHATVPSNAPVLPDNYQTLASVLQRAGYETGLFGKWHLGSSPRFAPNKYGFDASYGSLAGGVDPYNHCYKRGEFSRTWHRNGKLVDERGHVTDLITKEAIEWIESRDRPWFCYVPFTAVHVPVKAPQSWLNQYAAGQFDEDPRKDASFKKYAAYTAHMDDAIGRLLETLARTCQREKTLIVFTSDNGAMNSCPLHETDKYPGWQEDHPLLGSNLPFRGVKGQLYEGGIRTPTIVNWRGTLPPRSINQPVHVVDWMPTLTRLVGAEPADDPQWDGVDIWPLITGEQDTVRDRCLYWNFRGGAELCVRYGDWKLISRAGETQRENELFNIAEDPYEGHEVADRHPDRVQQLLELIDEQRVLDGVCSRDDVDSPMVS